MFQCCKLEKIPTFFVIENWKIVNFCNDPDAVVIGLTNFYCLILQRKKHIITSKKNWNPGAVSKVWNGLAQSVFRVFLWYSAAFKLLWFVMKSGRASFLSVTWSYEQQFLFSALSFFKIYHVLILFLWYVRISPFYWNVIIVFGKCLVFSHHVMIFIYIYIYYLDILYMFHLT